jgi:hypothetical protein
MEKEALKRDPGAKLGTIQFFSLAGGCLRRRPKAAA